MFFFIYFSVTLLDLHARTHVFPHRRSSDLALLLRFPLFAVPGQPPLISAAAEDRRTPAASELTTAPLAIVTDKGAFSFVVEIARSESEQAQGLKHRRPLAPDRGMIFPMRPARLASFWMKDTPSPLDIIFLKIGRAPV